MANPQTANNGNKGATAKGETAKKPELDTLFDEYSKLNVQVETARLEVTEAMAARSDVVESIMTHFGAGPYEFDGLIMQAVTRTTKPEDGEEGPTTSTSFFKVMGKNQKLTKVGKKA
jgi:hypothetical protein